MLALPLLEIKKLPWTLSKTVTLPSYLVKSLQPS